MARAFQRHSCTAGGYSAPLGAFFRHEEVTTATKPRTLNDAKVDVQQWLADARCSADSSKCRKWLRNREEQIFEAHFRFRTELDKSRCDEDIAQEIKDRCEEWVRSPGAEDSAIGALRGPVVRAQQMVEQPSGMSDGLAVMRVMEELKRKLKATAAVHRDEYWQCIEALKADLKRVKAVPKDVNDHLEAFVDSLHPCWMRFSTGEEEDSVWWLPRPNLVEFRQSYHTCREPGRPPSAASLVP